MATTLAGESVTDVLEEAVQALRQAPLGTLAWYSAGVVPFGFGLLLFWSQVSRLGTTDARCAAESLLLTVLLVWMHCCRAIFAGRLRQQLSGAPDPPWTLGRVGRLIAGQSILGGSKLLVIPIAASALLPLGPAVAWYRSAAVFGGQEDLEMPQLLAKARRAANFEVRQNWTLIAILLLLFGLAFVNVAATLALLPHLVRALTGYESVFSRGTYLVLTNSLFWATALVLSWIVFDPLVQAVYAVRCFHADSRETGEDLRAVLRRLKGAARAAALLLLLVLPFHARAEVSAQALDQSIRQTLASPEYNWRLAHSAEPRAAGVPWLVEITDRLFDVVESALRRAGELIERFVAWLRGRSDLGGIPGVAAPPGGLHGSLYLLIAVLAVVACLLLWRMRRPRRQAVAVAAVASPVNLHEEGVLADRLPEESWIAMADDYVRRGDYRTALRALYLANLAWLGRRQLIGIHAGKTNREYATEVRRRARAFPQVSTLFAANIGDFERAWYGMHAVAATDAERFAQHLQEMKALIGAAP